MIHVIPDKVRENAFIHPKYPSFMDDRSYSGYLLIVILATAFTILWNFFYLTEGFYHRYISAFAGICAFIWFAINLALIFVEGLEDEPDARKLFLPAWYVIGFIVAAMFSAYHLRYASSVLEVGTTYGTWWVVLTTFTAFLKLFIADMLLWQFNTARPVEE